MLFSTLRLEGICVEYELSINEDPKCAVVVACGKAEAVDFTRIVRDLINHKEFKVGMSFLHDYRNVDVGNLSVNDARGLAIMAGSCREEFGKGRWALLMSDGLAFGMARIWHGSVDARVDIAIEVFRETDEAIKWIEGR